MKISFQSDTGQVRKNNQDYVAIFKNTKGYSLALLADGMGGHRAGDVASKTAVEDIGGKWERSAVSDSQKAASWLIKVIQEENETIYQSGLEHPEFSGMGTTIEAAAVFAEDFTLAHVGDSRGYVLKHDQLIQITDDHSLVNELVKSGEITKEMAENHPNKNIVTRCVGMPGTIDVDVYTQKHDAHQYLLLCSDGLTNMVSDADIKQILLDSENDGEALHHLIERANQHGGLDNITVLVIQFGGVVDA